MAPSESAALLGSKPNGGGSITSKVGGFLACLAVIALGAVVVVSTVNFRGSSGAVGPNDRALALAHDLEVLEAELGANTTRTPLTPFCRAEVIDFQRSFVKGLEAFFSKGCGGESFDPFTVRDDILQEKAAHSTAQCEQKIMNRVFTRTFTRVYG